MLTVLGTLLRKHIFRIILSPALIGLLLIGVSAFINTYLTTDFPAASLIGWGGVYMLLAVIPLVVAPLLPAKSLRWPALATTAAGVLLSVTSVLEQVGFGPSIIMRTLFGLQQFQVEAFNLTGSTFIAAQVLAVALVTSVVSLIFSKRDQIWFLFTLPILVVGLGLTVWLSLPGKSTSAVITPLSASWNIAIEALRSPRVALIGVGPEQYDEEYRLLRPLSLNVSEVWNQNFTVATNTLLTLFTTLGTVGLAGWIIMVIMTVRQTKSVQPEQAGVFAAILSIFVLQFFFPPNIVLTVMLLVLLTVMAAMMQEQYHILELHPIQIKSTKGNKSSQYASGFSVVMAAIGLVVVGTVGFTVGRTYMALATLFQAEVQAQEEGLVAILRNQQIARNIQPNWDFTHRILAETSLGIALILANPQEGEELSTEQIQQITDLVTLAIREGNVATIINPANASNWVTVANVYTQLIGSSEDNISAQRAIDNYLQAINRAPTDPILRNSLGGVFFRAGEFQQAALLFDQARQLKPDLPITYVNLGNALAESGAEQQALAAYEEAKNQARGEEGGDQFIEQVDQLIAALPERAAAAVERIQASQQAALEAQQAALQAQQETALPIDDQDILNQDLDPEAQGPEIDTGELNLPTPAQEEEPAQPAENQPSN